MHESRLVRFPALIPLLTATAASQALVGCAQPGVESSYSEELFAPAVYFNITDIPTGLEIAGTDYVGSSLVQPGDLLVAGTSTECLGSLPGCASLTRLRSYRLGSGDDFETVLDRNLGLKLLRVDTAKGQADLNRDGAPDLITERHDEITVHFAGSNGFDSKQVLTLPKGSLVSEVFVRDLNGDGHLDLAISQSAEDALYFFYGGGQDDFFGPPHLYEHPETAALTVGDVDGDGVSDLLTTTSASTPRGALLSRGVELASTGDIRPNSFFAAQQVLTAEQPKDVLAADFDGDGDDEVAVALGAEHIASLAVLDGDFGSGELVAEQYSIIDPAVDDVSSSEVLATGDVVYGDGVNDLVVGRNSAGGASIAVFPGLGDGSFAGAITVETIPGSGIEEMVVGDINRDGFADIAATYRKPRARSLVLFGTGAATAD